MTALSVVFPCYNEAERLPATLEAYLGHLPRKGFAVRTGMLAAEGDRVVFTDAGGAYAPGEAERVVAALAEAPVAIGPAARTRPDGAEVTPAPRRGRPAAAGCRPVAARRPGGGPG